MRLIELQGFHFTVTGGTPYFVRLKPQLFRVKDADTAAAVLKAWSNAEANEAKAAEWERKEETK